MHKSSELDSCRQSADPQHYVWDWITRAARTEFSRESTLRETLSLHVLSRESLADAIASRIAARLPHRDICEDELFLIISASLSSSPPILEQVIFDMLSFIDRDPACSTPLDPFLWFKGFHALTSHRIAHHLWSSGRTSLALAFQSMSSETFGVDIHPAATLGKGIFLDHATSVVIGETAIIGDNVSILHEVTLGGTGKTSGNRHPIVKSGVLIGAGAKILGRVTIGECAKIGAGSVVLHDVPPHVTVAGVPATIVGTPREESPSLDMDQFII